MAVIPFIHAGLFGFVNGHYSVWHCTHVVHRLLKVSLQEPKTLQENHLSVSPFAKFSYFLFVQC